VRNFLTFATGSERDPRTVATVDGPLVRRVTRTPHGLCRTARAYQPFAIEVTTTGFTRKS